jgi:branched-chain amino acid aminotransferase
MVTPLRKIWMDGELVDWQDATVHVLTHTLHYGFGAFEGIRCYQREDGRSHIFRHAEHLRRLYESCRILTLDIPFSMETLREAEKETLRANGLRAGYLRPLVFMGEGPMGLGATANPTRVAIITWEWGAYLGDEGLKNGIRAKISSFARNHVNAGMAKGKIVGQYVNSILAKREAMKAGYQEAIMLDTAGYVSECSGENLFLVRNGVIHTPPEGSSILGGITRDTVLRLAADLGYEVRFSSFTRDQLDIADEVFLTGTAAEITPVREIDDRPIGSGKPGPVTQALQTLFFDIVKGKHEGYGEWLDWVEY